MISDVAQTKLNEELNIDLLSEGEKQAFMFRNIMTQAVGGAEDLSISICLYYNVSSMSANLKSGHIGLEFSVKDKTVDTITYVIRFFYDKYLLFNPAILSSDTIEFQVDQDHSFVAMLENVLKTNSKDIWVSSDQSLEIAAFPLPVKGWEAMKNIYKMFSDFPKTNPKRVRYLKNIDAERQKNHGSFPDDMFEIGCFFSSQKKDAPSEENDWPQHLGVKILCTRNQVEEFLEVLKNEIAKMV